MGGATTSLERATARPIFMVNAGRAIAGRVTTGAKATAGTSSRATAGERQSWV